MKKTHRIYARDPKVLTDGIKTSKGKVNFRNQTAVYVDEATAKEVNELHGNKKDGSVLVAHDEQYDRAVTGESWKVVSDRRGDWVKTLHKYKFAGIDTSHFKVWVYKYGKLVRVTKEEAKRKGYEIVSASKEKPKETDNGRMSAEV